MATALTPVPTPVLGPALTVTQIAKSFPGARALTGVTFELEAGEICALAGENGAGKSTLLGVLGGVHRPDAGTLSVQGVPRVDFSPRRALADGIQIARQEPAVVPFLTVDQNLQLGLGKAERRHFAHRIDRAYGDLHDMGFPLERTRRVSTLSPAQRQALGVARALARGSTIVALDEPTTSMVDANVQHVLACIRGAARDRGLAILYVSHRMNEVMAVADSVVVLRDGVVNHRARIADTSEQEIVAKMVGRQLLAFARDKLTDDARACAGIAMSVANARHGTLVGPSSFEVRAGEVLGIAGLVGAGRTELLRAVVHADPAASAEVTVGGRPKVIKNPRDSRSAGIAFVPEDRKKQGLVLGAPAYANVVLTADHRSTRAGFVQRAKQLEIARTSTRGLALQPADVHLNARQFSGGNQQKIVVAKWTWLDATVFLFDEPTKGVDVGGKVEIYHLIDRLAAQGKGIVVVSSELPELIALCDRVLVMRRGQVVAEHTGDDINEDALVRSAMGIGAVGISAEVVREDAQ